MPDLTAPELPVTHFHDHLGYWLGFVADHITVRLNHLLEVRDIAAPEWVVLRTLFDAPPLPHYVLAQVVCMTRPATWKVLRRLETRGLIRRELLPGKTRLQGLSLTAHGEALVPELAALAEDNEDYFFLHLLPGVRTELMYELRDLASRHDFAFRSARADSRSRP